MLHLTLYSVRHAMVVALLNYNSNELLEHEVIDHHQIINM